MTRAARKLHIGQPALSRTLMQFERAVGVPLFDRTAAGSTLTAMGDAYLTRARRAIVAFEHAVRPPEVERSLTVGYVWSALGALTNTVFEQWNGDDSHLEQLTLKRFQSRTSGVESGQADFGIVRYATPSIAYASLLYSEPRVVALPEGHRLAGHNELELVDLVDETIVMDTMSGTTTLDLWPPHRRPGPPAVHCGSVDEWNHLVSLGEGIGITAESTPHVHPYPGIRYVPMSASTPRIQVFCVWDSLHLSPVADEFCTVVRTVHERRRDAERN